MNAHVQKALAFWDMEGAITILAAQRENHVYRVDHNGATCALRFHRPGYRTEDELLSELHWCQHLADQGLTVPRPQPDRTGALLRQIGETYVSVLPWLSGVPIGEGSEITGDPQQLARQVGQEMARLHQITDLWQRPATFTRPDWAMDALVGDTPLWGPFWEHPDLTSDQVALLQQARAAARRDSALLDHDTGLIHADMLAENLLVDGDRLGLLDFDDSVTGYRAFELATFLLRYSERPDFADLCAALTDGYAARRRIDAPELDLALLLRALTYVGWIIPRRKEPGGDVRSKRMIAHATRLAQSYLERSPS
ncbi:Ser/Thr protein kinase RdoA involved in Cpx stress response, MazF antagonist [Shimia gijangensis]|uniref:Ser/Thr protein kinase RdoA involved in Cpx stress response, MazF antagonist n=1 Tax=Shimia gijangensis TaxID=1470563 RepID=A0A1M6CGI5_9RHOB|nr:phosphotransferase [Shimia gijangensis]SHI60033.1 Ser/Thr protein kinase RdoA involved in Cpx stress response, MazF antagonist [Shimia gijangensis]